MYNNLFTEAGLSKNEAVIYEYLLKNGESPALNITKNTPLNKGVVYVALNELIDKGLITEKLLPPKNPHVRNKKKIAYFSPEHPEKLRAYLSDQEAKLKKAQNSLEANLGELVSSFNMVSDRPGLRYFEGLAGIKQVTEDSLKTAGEIYTYLDTENTVKKIEKINNEYVKRRLALGIKKKIINADNPYTREHMRKHQQWDAEDSQLTQVKILDHRVCHFDTIMQIYDDKISYISFANDRQVGVIIQDPTITAMHKEIFLFNWSRARTLRELEQPGQIFSKPT